MALQPKLIKKRVVAIVKPDLSPLMKIIGVDEILEVIDKVNVDELFKNVSGPDDVGIILTQKSIIEKVSESVLEDIQSRLSPVIVMLPDSIDEIKKNPMDVYRSLIRKFIGFEIYM
ncbi:MAG: V-type ATP synthase subunit F [Ignisphaera sp.]